MPSEKLTEIRIFCSYSDEDRSLQESLEKHLSSLVREGGVLTWNRHKIKAGQERKREIDNQLKQADLILLLISSNFINSDDCYARDLVIALQRHEADRTRVIPILLKPCTWDELAFSAFQVLPHNGVPVTLYKNRDAAFKEIVDEIKTMVQELRLSKSGYMEPLQPNPLSNGHRANSLPTPTRRSRTTTTQRTPTTPRQGRQLTNQPVNALTAEATRPANTRYRRAMPRAHSFSSRDGVRQFFAFFISTLSGRAFKQRCKRWKGWSGVFLFLFAVLDLFLLPYATYQRSHSLIITGTIGILSLLFFFVGVFNKENAVGVSFALFYFPLWIIMGLWFLNNYLDLALSQQSVFIVVLIVTLFRLLLFLWQNPVGQR